MKKFNINTNLIQVIKNLDDKATSAVLFNSSIGDWFGKQLESDRDVYSHHPLQHVSGIFLEKIVTDALDDHKGTVSIGGRAIANLRFADDIDGLAAEEEELA